MTAGSIGTTVMHAPAVGGGRVRPAGGSGSTSAASSSSSASSTEDLSSASDAQLQALAAKGDVQALLELERREAARQSAQEAGVGLNFDTYA